MMFLSIREIFRFLKDLKCGCVFFSEQGVQLFDQGEYTQAVDMFTQAIFCDRTDYRWVTSATSLSPD